MVGLAHSVVSNLTKTSEGRLGDYGAEVRVRVERLQEFCRAHGFAEAVDAARMELIVRIKLIVEEVDPLVNVVALEQAVGRELAAAGAVGAGVGHKDRVSVSEEELSIAGHAEAIVSETVEQEDGVVVRVAREDEPGAQGDGVLRGDGDVDEVAV